MKPPKAGPRMYRYVAQDGTEFWSFRRYPKTVTPSIILKLNDRLGQNFENFMTEIRRESRTVALSPTESEVE